jgi:chromosome transmission fidelity protein 18
MRAGGYSLGGSLPPTCFTDFTGSDRVAREMMAWVKLWDYCIFGKKKGKTM